MRLLSSIGLAALLGGSCLIGAAHAATVLDISVQSISSPTYTNGASAGLQNSIALDIGTGTLGVPAVGSDDTTGLHSGSSISMSPTNIQYGSGTGNQSTALVADITKSWTTPSGPYIGSYSETLTTVDYIGRGAENAIVVLLQGTLTSPISTNTAYFLLNATQAAGTGGIVSWSGTETSFNPLATPLPAAFPLFATGLGAFGLLGWRRKRKAAAIAAA
jgi:hypothetical protein